MTTTILACLLAITLLAAILLLIRNIQADRMIAQMRKENCPDIMYAAMIPDICCGLFVDSDIAIEKVKHTQSAYVLMVLTEHWGGFSDMGLPSHNPANGCWEWMQSGMTVTGGHQEAIDYLMKRK